MIGYAFMGAAHSQAWRTAGHVAELPLQPEMAVVVGRHARRGCGGGRPAGLAGERRSTGGGDRAGRHRPGRHLHAGRHARRDRDRRAGRRQARAVREAAGQHRRRGGGDGGGRPAGARSAGDGGLHLPPDPGGGAGQGDGRGRHDRAVRQVRAQYLQDWLADEKAPLTWRLDKEQAGSGALGDIGAHIIDAVEFVTGQRLTGVSGLIETFVKQRPLAGRGRRPAAPSSAAPPARATGRSPSTTPRCSSAGWSPVRSPRSRPPGSRSAGRTPCDSRSTAPQAVSRSTSRT